MTMRARTLAIGVAIAASPLVAAVGAAPAAASFGVVSQKCPSSAPVPKQPQTSCFEAPVSELGGVLATQAGSHPYAMTTAIVFNNHFSQTYTEGGAPGNSGLLPDGNPRDIEVNLPAGMVVDPAATPTRCTEKQLDISNPAEPTCPESSAVGVATLDFGSLEAAEWAAPVYNMVPPPGVPAELGFAPANVGVVVHVFGKVRSGSDYGISGASPWTTQYQSIYGVALTLWGDPSAESHDQERGLCGQGFRKNVTEKLTKQYEKSHGPCKLEARAARPLLTMPSSCGSALVTTLATDSWQEPGVFPVIAPFEGAVVRGCAQLHFTPTISVRPETNVAGSPTGLKVDLHVPQNEDAEALAEANLKNTTVTLPAGVVVNPSQANGLVGCPLEGAKAINLHSPEAAHCPEEAKIGNVEVDTPLLEEPLRGGVYIAQQGNLPGNGSNPFGSLLAIYIVAEGSGVVVKLAGEVSADPVTGQLKTTFLNNPQLPFEDFKLDFFGGPRAALLTPARCGTYTTATSLAPWSGMPAASPSDSFVIGSGCASGFAPGFAAGTVSNQAGGFSPFALSFSRDDGEQALSGITVKTPPGLAGIIANVPLCGEAQANAGECPAASQIGTTTVSAGAGPDPVQVSGGRVYLTGPYKGQPFGLSIVVPAVAGPLNLGNVVVRASIAIDPHTAQIKVTSDPLPSILQGIPLDVRTVNVAVDRAAFMFNPTNCEPMSVGGTIGSTQGAVANVSSRFQAAGCAALAFKPKFQVSTSAKHSRSNGDSLHVVVQSGAGQANIGSVKVNVPKALPSRLSTLKLACTEAQFAANPAGCPAGSFVGTAKAYTPVLSVPLTGPAIFVSHGGAAFPDLDIVLQGEGVTVILTSNTFISKAGITSSTFRSVPDVPVTRFDLVLPAGPHSALAGNGNLCKGKLLMPTTIKGQNGAVVKQSTKIAVTGCPTAKKAEKARKASGRLGLKHPKTQQNNNKG